MCNLCEKIPTYNCSWTDRKGILHPAHACDDHVRTLILIVKRDMRMEQFAEKMEMYRKNWERNIIAGVFKV